MPFIVIFAAIAAQHKHAMDRANDIQRQQYALQVAEFNIQHHTNLIPTKKGVIVYNPQTGTASNEDINDVYHKAGHNRISQFSSNPPQAPSKIH